MKKILNYYTISQGEAIVYAGLTAVPPVRFRIVCIGYSKLPSNFLQYKGRTDAFNYGIRCVYEGTGDGIYRIRSVYRMQFRKDRPEPMEIALSDDANIRYSPVEISTFRQENLVWKYIENIR